MKKGFTLIEILIAIALSAIILPALVYILGFSLQTAKQSESYTKAYTLAQEQMEAVYSIKNAEPASWSWTAVSPANTSSGEYYQPYVASDVWQLGSKTSSPIETDGYVKKVSVSQVKRDASGVISTDPWAVADDNSRWVSVYVSWKENGVDTEVKLVSLVTRY